MKDSAQQSKMKNDELKESVQELQKSNDTKEDLITEQRREIGETLCSINEMVSYNLLCLVNLQNQQRELVKRLSNRDDMLHRVTTEATRLKDKYRNAAEEVGTFYKSSSNT